MSYFRESNDYNNVNTSVVTISMKTLVSKPFLIELHIYRYYYIKLSTSENKLCIIIPYPQPPKSKNIVHWFYNQFWICNIPPVTVVDENAPAHLTVNFLGINCLLS